MINRHLSQYLCWVIRAWLVSSTAAAQLGGRHHCLGSEGWQWCLTCPGTEAMWTRWSLRFSGERLKRSPPKHYLMVGALLTPRWVWWRPVLFPWLHWTWSTSWDHRPHPRRCTADVYRRRVSQVLIWWCTHWRGWDVFPMMGMLSRASGCWLGIDGVAYVRSCHQSMMLMAEPVVSANFTVSSRAAEVLMSAGPLQWCWLKPVAFAPPGEVIWSWALSNQSTDAITSLQDGRKWCHLSFVLIHLDSLEASMQDCRDPFRTQAGQSSRTQEWVVHGLLHKNVRGRRYPQIDFAEFALSLKQGGHHVAVSLPSHQSLTG